MVGKKCPNCKKFLLKIYPNIKYLREGSRINHLETVLNKSFFYGCEQGVYAKSDEVWK